MSQRDQLKEILEKFAKAKKDDFDDIAFDQPLDQMDMMITETMKLEQQLVENLTAAEFNALIGKVSYGTISLTPSSKVAGLWQVTFFNDQMLPLGDLGCVEKSKGIQQFLDDVGHLIDVDDLMKQII